MLLSSHRLIYACAILIAGGGLLLSEPGNSAQPGGGGTGPDVIVGDIPTVMRFGTLSNSTSFSIATTSCNVGDTRLDWLASPGSAVHPVITQNLYRVANGRIEQIGMSWLKHGFSVAARSDCGTCQDPGFNFLGVNCSDPYSAGLNGIQGGLGPRSEVNATTGIFPVPFSKLPQPRNVLDGRIRVKNLDLDPAQNMNAKYFVESQYIHPQDAAAGNGLNNASHREVAVEVRNGNELHLKFPSGSSIVREQSAIKAWADVDSDVEVRNVDVPHDGRFVVGIRSTPIAGGRFATVVAVQNLNSHRSARFLKLACPTGTASALNFHDIDYQHEPYSGADWTAVASTGIAEWTTETFATNQNANALRWGTVYTFWCESDSKPTSIQIGLFRPGNAGDPENVVVDLNAIVPPLALLPKPEEAWISVERAVDLGVLPNDKSFEIEVKCRAGGDDAVSSVKSSSPMLAAEVVPYAQNKNDSKIRIRPSATASAGYFESILTINPRNEFEKAVTIRVFGELEE